jgi:gp6-like head-tail connector protein
MSDPIVPADVLLGNIQVPTQTLSDLGGPSLPAAFEDRDNFVRDMATVLTGGTVTDGGDTVSPPPPVTPSDSASSREPLLTLPEIKAQCHIELDQTVDDDYLMQLEMAARLHTENYLRYQIDATVGENIKQACLILIADWYRNRELMRDGRWVDAPIAWKALLSMERDYPTYT